MGCLVDEIRVLSLKVRQNIITAGFKGGASHFGGSLSVADILCVIYGALADVKKISANEPDRDRVIMSKGHCSLALYAVLQAVGLITEDDLMSFDRDGGDFPTHCVRNFEKHIELTSGSLGLGLSFAAGIDLALKEKGIDKEKIYVICGDGELNEGSFWEGANFAAFNHLDNLILIIDKNDLQIDGYCSTICSVIDYEEKLKSFGFATVQCNGHDPESLLRAFESGEKGKPLAVVANTVKGKGVSFMENNHLWHHNKLTQEQYEAAMSELSCGEKVNAD